MSVSVPDTYYTPAEPGIMPQARKGQRETAGPNDVGRETRPRIGQRETAIARHPSQEAPVRKDLGDSNITSVDIMVHSHDLDFASTSSCDEEMTLGDLDWPTSPDSPSPPPGYARKRLRSRTLEYPIASPTISDTTANDSIPSVNTGGPTLPDYPPAEDDPAEGNELDIHIDDGTKPATPRRCRTGARSAHKSFSKLILTGSLIKLGDHSVHTDGVSADILMRTPPAAAAPIPNYISHMSQHIHASSGTFDTAAGARRMTSHLTRRQPGGGYFPAVEVTARVFRMFDAPIPDAGIATCEVSFVMPIWKGSIPPEALETFKRGGIPDERAVHSALNPILHPADLNVTRQLAHFIDSQALIPNNMMLYAKILWHMMIHITNTTYGHVAAAIPFPEGNIPMWINLDDAATTAQQIATSALRGDIIFVQDIDYFGGDDLQLVYWLSKPGRRLTSPDGAQCPHACYMKWPAIPVTILGRGPAPQAPAAAALSWRGIWQLLRRWASARNEQQDLVMGIYWVLSHFGIAYFNTAAHPIYEFVLPDLGCNNIPTPRPTDYNFIARLLHIFPAPQDAWVGEINAWEASSADALTDMAVVYSYAISVFAGNVFYNYNVTPYLLQSFNTGNLPGNSLSYVIMNALSASQGYNQESKLHQMVWASFQTYMGVRPCTGVACGRPWSGIYGHRADAATSYSAFVPHQAPRIHSYLALDDWLILRPLEWGIPGDNTTVNLAAEVVLLGAGDNRGWFGNRGSSEYANAVKGSSPFQICPYGAMALTTIAQATDSLPIIFEQRSGWTFGCDPQWSAPVHNPLGTWNQELHALEPGSLLSYDYVNNNVLAPCAVLGPQAWNVHHSVLTYLAGLRDQRLDCVGITIKSSLQVGVATTMFHGMDLGSFFGVAGSPTPTTGIHPAAAVGNPVPAVHLDNAGHAMPQDAGGAPANVAGVPLHPP